MHLGGDGTRLGPCRRIARPQFRLRKLLRQIFQDRKRLPDMGVVIRQRRHLPMNMRRPVMRRELTDEAHRNVERVDAIWTRCRTRFAGEGAFLFGRFGAADAMYAPVVARFHTYDVAVGALSRAYMQAVMALPAWSEWRTAALAETWVLPEDEVDWPAVPGL